MDRKESGRRSSFDFVMAFACQQLRRCQPRREKTSRTAGAVYARGRAPGRLVRTLVHRLHPGAGGAKPPGRRGFGFRSARKSRAAARARDCPAVRFPVGPVSAKFSSSSAISRRDQAAGGLGRHPDPLALHGVAELRTAPPNQGARSADIVQFTLTTGGRMERGWMVFSIQYSLSRLSYVSARTIQAILDEDQRLWVLLLTPGARVINPVAPVLAPDIRGRANCPLP